MERLGFFLGFLVYFIGYSSSDIAILGENFDWKQAMNACESNGGSLPEVSILNTGLGQKNNMPYEKRCIWLKASYERTYNQTDYSYPNICCEVMFRDENGTVQRDCVSCLVPYEYICASASNNISLNFSKNEIWSNADRDCRNKALFLPSDTNNEFLQQLTFRRRMWINGVRTLNTNSLKGDGLFPVCSCNGIPTLTCPSKTWTYCVLDPKNEGRSESPSYFTTSVSVSSYVPTHSSGNLQASSDSSIRATTNENGALIGGVAGTSVVLTMIIIIVVVIVLRRSKQTQNKNSNSQNPVDHDNFLNATMQVNPPYDDVNGDVPNTDKHASIQIQHMEKESITYANTTKVPGSSEISLDKYNGITSNEEKSRTDVYSKVKKRPKPGQNLIAMNQLAVGDEEYDKINFDKSYQPQKAADVYDKTNFCCKDQEKILENVYNKAEFYHKHQNVDAGNIYDKPNFDGVQQNKHSENAHTDEKGVSPGQRSTYNYA